MEFTEDARIQLLKKLDDALEPRTVSRETWAFLWLGDVEELRKWVARAEDNSFMAYVTLDAAVRRATIAQNCMLE